MSKVNTATLFLICGKIAAGKSALAAKLSTAPSTILISEDQWLARLYKPEMRTVADYIQYSARLREVMGRACRISASHWNIGGAGLSGEYSKAAAVDARDR
jgi:hypothetical protein